MRKFQQLEIRGTKEDLRGLLSRMKESNIKSFVYQAKKSEEYAKNIFCEETEVAVFKSPNKKYFEGYVWLAITDGVLRVANITSSINSDLGISNYNFVLNAFFSEIVRPLLSEEADVVIKGENLGLRDMMSEQSAKLLEVWEVACNKSSPTSHPLDEERWFSFICSIANEESEFSPEDLEKWLSEDKEWPLGYQDEIDKLAIEYENDVRLLKYYLEHYGNR